MCKEALTNEEAYEKAYKKGLRDAWEAARKIGGATKYGGYTGRQLNDVFGSDLYQDAFYFAVETAIEKIKAYEEKQSKVRVGDEVENDGETMIVTKITSKDAFCGVKENGLVCYGDITHWKKTGKHYHEIEKLFGSNKD